MNPLGKYLGIIIVLVVVAAGALVVGLGGVGRSGTGTSSPSSTNRGQVTSIEAPKVGDFFPYDCSLPVTTSELSCDQLPAGYVILPPNPAAPRPYRLSGMTDSAWALLQKTYANGVCDPNETGLTDPLDCGATGALVNDPFTGRPNAAAGVCQQFGPR